MRDELVIVDDRDVARVVLPVQYVVPPRKPRTEDDLLPTLPLRRRHAR